MKRTLPTIRAAGAASMLALLLLGPVAAATSYDLKAQWSAQANPHGPWALVQGGTLLPRVKDWTPISQADAAYNPDTGHIRQPAFAPGAKPGSFLPAWFKAAVTPADAAYGWRKGDVLVHTTDMFNGIGSGSAAVVFTAPTGGGATVSSYVCNARNMHRPQRWQLAVNGAIQAEGALPGDGTFTRDHKQLISLSNVALNAGDQIVLTLVEDGGQTGPGDFIGVDLKVVLP